MLTGNTVEGSQVLGETRSSIPQTGMQKPRTNSNVHSDASGDLFNICINVFSQIRHSIDERDLQRQKRIRSVLYDLGTLRASHQEFSRIAIAAWTLERIRL